MNSDYYAILVVGSRGINDYAFIKHKLDKILSVVSKKYKIKIVSGGANGVDKLAERYAKERGYELKVFPADWDLYGKKAGPIRNKLMHKHLSHYEHRAVVAFWDGKSKGTAQSFELAKKYEATIRVIEYH